MAGLVRWAVAAGLTLAASAAGAQEIAQVMAPYEIDAAPARPVVQASDIGGPYAAMPPQAAMPRPAPAPALLPPREIYGLLRDDGYAPVGTPRLRGAFYTVAVTDPDGEDGRVVIDGRSGRIVRFIPAEADLAAPLWRRPAPQFREFGPVPRPPLAVPRVASRSAVPLPKPAPAQPVAAPAQPVVTQPAPAAAQAQQSAAAPAPAPVPAAAPAPVDAKPTPVIAPTQAMPAVQGLE